MHTVSRINLHNRGMPMACTLWIQRVANGLKIIGNSPIQVLQYLPDLYFELAFIMFAFSGLGKACKCELFMTSFKPVSEQQIN